MTNSRLKICRLFVLLIMQKDKKTVELIRQDFDLSLDLRADEKELLRILSDRIAQLIAERPEYLFSLLYRLDVSEEKVHKALSNLEEKPANILLAELVLQRQKQRAATRLAYKQKPLDDEMAW